MDDILFQRAAHNRNSALRQDAARGFLLAEEVAMIAVRASTRTPRACDHLPEISQAMNPAFACFF